jgi:CubicO group peptidase (beta-lactamase class C family)
VDVGGDTQRLVAGWADRAHGVPMQAGTRLGLASVTKGLTALTVLGLVERGGLGLDTTARSLLGPDLPLVDDRVTVEHLLAHRSGIGDYLDEEQITDIDTPPMPVPVHRLAATDDYLAVLDGHPQISEPGAQFAYNNAGYVVLAMLTERATGTAFPELVDELVCRPAGMHHTAFLRSDELPGDTALGYLHVDGLRTNVLHLPVRGCGDGGAFGTADDLHALWAAWMGGRVVSPATIERMTTPHSTTSSGWRYGLGCWRSKHTDAVELEGHDAGVSAWTGHRPATGVTATVLSNTSEGAWPLVEALRAYVDAG